ncbi:hypothetical protein LINPERPRIM_LOCUS20598 [Linum perenne]
MIQLKLLMRHPKWTHRKIAKSLAEFTIWWHEPQTTKLPGCPVWDLGAQLRSASRNCLLS